MSPAPASSPHSSVLVTGGAGYLGSHMAAVLAEQGRHVVVLDNLSRSAPDAPARLQRLAGDRVSVVEADVRDEAALAGVFNAFRIGAVMHFAGLKSVVESVREPLAYHSANVGGTISLVRQMAAAGVHALVFSSSAAVYGEACRSPIAEDSPVAPASPYGRSKLMAEGVLADLCAAQPHWRVACLRYFNPLGAHPSGLLGEWNAGMPDNLMPYVIGAASGALGPLPVFGDDYPTPDGTGVRDFIHVMDLVEGHLAALQHLERCAGLTTVNLGTGRGTSVLELVRAFEAAVGRSVPIAISARRPGDVAECYAHPGRARDLFRWQARRTLEDMCRSSWTWATARAAAPTPMESP